MKKRKQLMRLTKRELVNMLILQQEIASQTLEENERAINLLVRQGDIIAKKQMEIDGIKESLCSMN